MIDFLIDASPLFSFPMTIFFLVNIGMITRGIFFLYMKNLKISKSLLRSIDSIKYLGIIMLSLGILGQLIGLYSAFETIERNTLAITPSLLAGGFKTSSVTTILGLIYFIISYGAWYVLQGKAKTTTASSF